MSDYIELHCHSCFSFREGASTPLELVLQARKLGYPALALTDHDGLAGAMEFAQTAKEWGVQPIIGAEITLRQAQGGALRPRTDPRVETRGFDDREAAGFIPQTGSQGDRMAAPTRSVAEPFQARRARLESLAYGENAHLTLLAETPRGYANLSRLLSMAHLDSPRPDGRPSGRGEPALDPTALEGRTEGLIALSGCRDGEVPALVAAGDAEGARRAAGRYLELFGRERFFLELQDNLVYGDRRRNRGLVELARRFGVGVVATNNVHYHERARHRLQDVLVAVRHRTTLDASERLRRKNSESYLKSPEEMSALFADLPEALRNSVAIAERCVAQALPMDGSRAFPGSADEDRRGTPRRAQGDRMVAPTNDPTGEGTGVREPGGNEAHGFDLTRDLTYQFPDYDSGDGRTADEVLEEVCFASARELYGWAAPSVEERLRKELSLIAQAGHAGFFLRNWQLIQHAHEHDLPVRGRGSSVGSLVCYLLGLSGIDPIKYNLFSGRFLNEARQKEDVPDIDLDFAREARERMFEHVFETYGTEHAALVANVIQYRYPMAIRDVGKALGLPETDVDRLAKRMRGRFAGSLAEEMRALPEFRSRMQAPVWREFARLVEELRGMPRHLSQHSGGVVISSTPIVEQVPVQPSAMDGRYICQWDKDSVADAGFIKMDFLGYPSLGHLQRSLRLIEERHGKRIDPVRIPLDDPRVYEMIQRGDILGIVQIQSRAQLQAILRLKISCIEDLVVQVALIRPGPIQGGAVNPYILRCQGAEPVTYDHPCLEPVLGETKGVIIFQEQVLQVAMEIAGFTAGQAESLRRAMSRKRSGEAMEKLRDAFMAGARNKGLVDDETAGRIFEKVLAFAEFGFPKSHAAAMAETAGKLAWVKLYYPLEFYCSWLNEQPFGFYSPGVIVNEARRNGVEVLGVDANRSRVECIIERLDQEVTRRGEHLPARGDRTVAPTEADRSRAFPGSASGEAGKPRLQEGTGAEAIRLGFRYVKGIGAAWLERLDPSTSSGQAASVGPGQASPSAHAQGDRTVAPAPQPYASLWDFWRRTRLPWEPIEHLIRLGAFEWTGLHERELLWQLGLFYEPLNAQLPLALPFDANMVALPSMSDAERVRQDLVLTDGAITTRGHIMDLAVTHGEAGKPRLRDGDADNSRKGGRLPAQGDQMVAPTANRSRAFPGSADSEAGQPRLRDRGMDAPPGSKLHEGVTPSHLVERLEEGAKVTVAGFVAVRQAPETAKGFVFHTLEDRHGLVNIITTPNMVRRYKELVTGAGALIVHGHIERQERAVNVITERMERLALDGADLPHERTHNFR